MAAQIIVQPKWVKGKQCMSTQVSIKHGGAWSIWWQMPRHLIFHKAASLCLSSANGSLEDRKDTGLVEDMQRMNLAEEEELGVIFCSLCRGPAKALHLCQTLPFYFNYPISMIQVCVRALRGWSWKLLPSSNVLQHSRYLFFYLASTIVTFHPRCGMRLPYFSMGACTRPPMRSLDGLVELSTKPFPGGSNRMFFFPWLSLSLSLLWSSKTKFTSAENIGRENWGWSWNQLQYKIWMPRSGPLLLFPLVPAFVTTVNW